jgi:anti-anti-sigma regulatory factor
LHNFTKNGRVGAIYTKEEIVMSLTILREYPHPETGEMVQVLHEELEGEKILFRIAVKQEPWWEEKRVSIIYLEGAFEGTYAQDLKEQLRQIFTVCHPLHVEVNLSGLETIDASGVETLLWAYLQCDEKEVWLPLIGPFSPRVRSMLYREPLVRSFWSIGLDDDVDSSQSDLTLF